MSGGESLREILQGIASNASEDMSERDVENLFLEGGFYQELGYEGTGADIRSEWTLPDDRRPDYITLDEHEAVTAVYEFKTTGRDLSPHTSQLLGYMDDLKAGYGVLTNGERFELYERGQSRPILAFHLEGVSDAQARDVDSALKKPTWDITDPESVNAFVEGLDPVGLDGELGQAHFFDTFRLEEDSPFADLVVGMMDLLAELRDEQEAKFVAGAYDFWEASYASVPDDVPDSWEPFIDGRASLRDFMFCLESGHALLARLLLAKACEDRDFFPANTGINQFFDELQGFGNAIDLDAYPVAAQGLLGEMQRHLVESLFEDDIFIWWTDGFEEETTSLHASPYSRFRDVAKEGSSITRVSQATRERFSRAVAEVFFATLKFDFANVAGDPLGDLYQHYFDPETRKALGEFYTPQEVVEYILDGVGYESGISNERLIDPACGSGTFLVEAIRRYLDDVRRYEDDPDWSKQLMELCSRPHIVGLDIHPFAVLMAQIRFMITILPEYREAKSEDPNFTIRRLPIFRTDTLRNERESTGLDLGDDDARQMTFDAMTEDSQDVLIPVPLPIEVEADEEVEREGDFLVQRVRMPLFDTIRLETGVSNFGEYFAALQGVLDVVKFHMSEDRWEYEGGLEQGINRYTSREYEGVEAFFAPYVDDILSTMRYLDKEHGDGRLFKMFEDSVLALVVKNYMDYEYVVGNPPYVRVQRISNVQQEYLEHVYASASGAYDLYYLFYERGINILSEGGRLGFITPSQFMTADDGGPLRHTVRTTTRIREVLDFRGAGVFEDALNYPAIVLLEKAGNGDATNEILTIRVRADYDETPEDLGERIMESANLHRTEPGYSDNNVDVFTFPQSELTDGDWALMPPSEYEVFEKLRRKSDTNMESITDAVFQGLRTGANGIFIVDLLDANRIEPEDTGQIVTIQPTGSGRTYEVESDLLCPWLERDAFRRWQADWDGKHLIIPYDVNNDLLSPEVMEDRYPLTWDYFVDHRGELENREGGALREAEDWYKLARPQNLSRFPSPKLIGKEFSDSAQFMPDEGYWHFASGYGLSLADEFESETNYVAAILNSKTSDFYLKHIASIKSFSPVKAYYAYRTRYLNQIPFNYPDGANRIESAVMDIRDVLDDDTRTKRFPEAYLGEFDGEIEFLDYEWQTRRNPVDAEIQQRTDGTYAIEAGRSDGITGPQIDSEERARYVHAAVDGRNVKSGEEQTIPIPRRDDDVSELLGELEEDRAAVAATDIEELEAEIDEIVYDLFDLTEDEREVIEEYLEVF